jgi:tight adherence protein B
MRFEIIVGVCFVASVAVLAYGLYLLATRRRSLLAQRVQTYTAIEEEAAVAAAADKPQFTAVGRLFNILLGRGYLQRVEEELARADVPMRPSEYILLRLVLAVILFVVGVYGIGYVRSGLFLGLIGYLSPAVFVKVHEKRRREKFVRQLADALMLLTNSLRSGYSFLKGLELVAKEMEDPISKELNRMQREVSLGATVEEALLNLARRVNSQDMDIVVSAFLVQKDVGGNLTEIMEKVAETIRERLRIQGDIKVLTAQGRLSGLVVGLMPIVVFIAILFLGSSEYFAPLWGPPVAMNLGGFDLTWGMVALIAAGSLQLMGFYMINKIISIKV